MPTCSTVRAVLLTAFLVRGFVCPLAADESARTVRLWDGPAPEAKGDGPEHVPAMYVYPADPETANGAAVLVFPGGGYHVHAIDHEGVQVAMRLNRAGVAAFVVQYRLKPDGYTEHDAFLDGRRAVRAVRARAKEFGVDPGRIGVLGFSAGGHLASAVGVHFDQGDADAADPVEQASSRPDFVVLGYTVPAPVDRREGREHGRKPITECTPPFFMWTTHADRRGPAETAEFYAMLREAGVDAELHIFGAWGPHGLGLAPAEPGIGAWPDLLVTWMRRKGLLTGAARVPVSGQVRVDGRPLHRGWVSFVPLDEPGAPVAAAYITHKADGRFDIPAEHGPVPGRHRVEIYRVAKEFLTVPSMGDAERLPEQEPDALSVDIAPGRNVSDFDLLSPSP